MNRTLFTLLFSIISQLVFAQQDSVYYFDKNDDRATKDSADYWRVVSVQKGNRYKVAEYHKDGTWTVGFATGDVKRPHYTGVVQGYYKDGKLANKYEYRNGDLFSMTGYYPNGKVIHIIQYVEHHPLLVYDADSSGRVHVMNGTGRRQETDSVKHEPGLIEKFTMEGPYKDGLRNGVWKGVNNRGWVFEERYEAGKLISGVTKTSAGKKYHYTSLYIPTTCNGNYRDVEKHIRYDLENLSDTLKLKLNIFHALRLSYTVNEKGFLEDICGYNATDLSLIRLTLRYEPPKVNPAKLRGVPVKCHLDASYTILSATQPMLFNKAVWITVKSPLKTE